MEKKEVDPAMWPYTRKTKFKLAETKSALSDGLDIKKYVRCGTCDSGLSIVDVDYMPLSKVPGNKHERCLFDCPACGSKSGSFIFFKI